MNPTTSTYHLHELTRIRDPHLLPWMDLYESAFPAMEREPVSRHISTMLAREDGLFHRGRMWALVDREGSFAGMAQTSYNADYRLAYLGYIAITPERRGGGCGSIFYQMLLQQVQENQPDFMLFDVERPDVFADPELRRLAERRIGFYERLGAAVLPGVTMYWGKARQRMMFHRLTRIEEQEILNRARALVGAIQGEIRED